MAYRSHVFEKVRVAADGLKIDPMLPNFDVFPSSFSQLLSLGLLIKSL